MMNIDAMRALLAAVEAGGGPADDLPAILRQDVVRSWHGDMNAALALHGALLPGWRYSLVPDENWPSGSDAMRAVTWPRDVTLKASVFRPIGRAPTPARALLIATLRGVIAKMDADEPAY